VDPWSIPSSVSGVTVTSRAVRPVPFWHLNPAGQLKALQFGAGNILLFRHNQIYPLKFGRTFQCTDKLRNQFFVESCADDFYLLPVLPVGFKPELIRRNIAESGQSACRTGFVRTKLGQHIKFLLYLFLQFFQVVQLAYLLFKLAYPGFCRSNILVDTGYLTEAHQPQSKHNHQNQHKARHKDYELLKRCFLLFGSPCRK